MSQPRTRTIVLYIAATLAAAAAAAAGGGALADSLHDDKPSTALSCKAAMQRNFDEARAHPDAKPQGQPIECVGVDSKTLQRYVSEITERELGKGLKDAWDGSTAQP